MAADDPFEPGRCIGSYEIVRELGRGGMGRVYLARDSAVGGRLVAVKVILAADRDESTEAHVRFVREVKNLARLRHPNIVTVYAAGNWQGYPYFVMEYIAGRDLTHYLDECSMLGEPERIAKVVHLIATVARTVHYAHTQGVVHRDLKPANILISHDRDQAMVLDFGIAKYLGDTTLTRGTESPGTPAYRAPEQVDVRLKVRDELIDVWQLGVILYKALTGTYPFKGNDVLSLAVQITQSAPEPPRALNTRISPSLEQIILACLEKGPQERPESASRIADSLEGLLTDARRSNRTLSTSAPDLTTATSPVAGKRPWRASAVWAWVTIASAVAVAAAGGWVAHRFAARTTTSVSFNGTTSSRHPVDQLPASRNAGSAAGMVAVPAGPFFMGCNPVVDADCFENEKPGRTETLPDFAIDRTEVTVAAFRECVDAGGCSGDGLTIPYFDWKERPDLASYCNWAATGRSQHPINCVDWYQASAYCEWVGKRLPTEAEWEKAARGSDGRKYPWGNDWGESYAGGSHRANISDKAVRLSDPEYDDGYSATAPAGSFPDGASPLGAQDMIGNVEEWVADAAGDMRMLRGGGFGYGLRAARVSWRDSAFPRWRMPAAGFRCVR